MWHARRPKPSGEDGGRYFVDVSYCQHGTRWPSYGGVHQINEKALQMGLDRDGRYAYLYDGSCFFDAPAFRQQFNDVNEGNLIHHLLGAV